LLDRLQFIYCSRQGILPFLQRLQRQEKIEDHAWKDLSFNFPLERVTVAKAGDVMQRHISDLKARFGEDISDFLVAVIGLKFAVRSVIEGLQTALRKDYFLRMPRRRRRRRRGALAFRSGAADIARLRARKARCV
jgi:hypothetical protein